MSFDDPFFTILGFLTGAFVCLSSGLLVLLTLLLEPRDGRADFVVLLSLIAFGCGAAAMRVTADSAQSCLAQLVGLY